MTKRSDTKGGNTKGGDTTGSNKVLLSVDEKGIATISFNRPQARNAFDEETIRLATSYAASLANNPDIRFLIVTAEGEHFSAGADLNWMKRAQTLSVEENLRDAEALSNMLCTIQTLPFPTLAIAKGSVFGGAVGVLACADIVLARTDSIFSFSEVRLGLIPAVISPYVVGAIGARIARRYFLTAERFDVEDAREMGLVHHVFEPHEEEEIRRTFVELLLDNGPLALRKVKELFPLLSSTASADEIRNETVNRLAACRVCDESKEGIAAFFEKRPPAWRSSPKNSDETLP